MPEIVELDVRPVLRAGGEPLTQIMEAVKNLAPGQDLRLFSPFMPGPLLQMLGAQGFRHEVKELAGGEWQVDFTASTGADGEQAGAAADSAAAASVDAGADWPAPVREMDNRELDPPEPMARILAATETMARGEVLAALLCREPMFLFPELARRGHSWRGGFDPDGKTYRVLVRVGVAQGATS